MPGVPGLPALPGLPPPALLLTLPGLPSPALAFLPYPVRPLRLGETLADEVRLTESEFRFSALLDGALQRRTTLTEAPAGAGRGAVRLTTGVLVPVGGRFDGPGLTLRGTVEAQVTQDVDRATGWPRAAEGVLRVAGVLTEDAPAERTTAEVELRLTLRER